MFRYISGLGPVCIISLLNKHLTHIRVYYLYFATCSVCLMLCCCKAADKKLIQINFRTPRFVRTTRATILARRNREHLLSTLSIPPGEGAAVRPPSDHQQLEEVAPAGERRKPTAPATPTGRFLVRAAVEDNHGITRK